MLFWIYLVPGLAYNAVFIDQEGLSIDAHVLLTIHVLLSVDPVELRNARICIGE